MFASSSPSIDSPGTPMSAQPALPLNIFPSSPLNGYDSSSTPSPTSSVSAVLTNPRHPYINSAALDQAVGAGPNMMEFAWYGACLPACAWPHSACALLLKPRCCSRCRACVRASWQCVYDRSNIFLCNFSLWIEGNALHHPLSLPKNPPPKWPILC